jgi:hypothetical protein
LRRRRVGQGAFFYTKSTHSKGKIVENNSLKPVVMFVDDGPQVLKAIRRVVRNEHYDPRFAAGGEKLTKILFIQALADFSVVGYVPLFRGTLHSIFYI